MRIQDAIQSVTNFKRYAWLAGGGAVVVIFAYCAGTCAHKAADTPAGVDSLRWENQALGKANTVLTADLTRLQQEKDSVAQERDSLKAASDSATARIERSRRKLPKLVPAVVPDSELKTAYTTLREAYVIAYAQLNSAVFQLNQKDRIIKDDSVTQSKSDSIALDWHGKFTNVSLQYKNEQTISAKWKKMFEDDHRHCGMKCGMVLGVLETVGAAVVVKKVQDSFVKRP